MPETKKREIWVDNVKVLACALVVLGHFFQSMTKAGILPANDLSGWFDQTIYYFHVPLFFICSGFLYQRLSKVDSLKSWGKNVLKKALNLGVPYFAFSFATWLLKTVFSSSTNDRIGGLFDTLFVHPTSPYWYLYALIFIFLITPTFGSKKASITGLIVALTLKVLGIAGWGTGISAISYVVSNEIWFVIGMCLSVWNVKRYLENLNLAPSLALGTAFTVLSVFTYKADIQHGAVGVAMGLIACGAVILLTLRIFRAGNQLPVFGYLSQYTMPIFLMHTLFAAPLRTVLLKIGIQNAPIHVALGIMISFVGPIAAAVIMKKSKWLEFFMYPGKLIQK